MTSLPMGRGRVRRPLQDVPRGMSPFSAFSLLLAAAVILLTVVSLGMVILKLFIVDGAFTIEPIRHTLAQPDLASTIVSTLSIVTASTVIAVMIGGGLAWLNERTDARMGLFSDLLPMIPFLVPPVAGSMGWMMLLAPKAGYLNNAWWWLLERFGIHTRAPLMDIYSWHGMVFVFSIYGVAFTYMMIAPALRTLDSSLEEQSRVSGAGGVKTMMRVTLPAVMPAVIAGALLWIWIALVTVDIPMVIGTPADIPMLSTELVSALRHTFPVDRALAVGLSSIVAVIVMAVWLIHHRVMHNQRHSTMGSKGSRTVPVKLGRWRTPVRLAMLGYMGLTTVLPFGALLVVAVTGSWRPTIHWSSASLDRFTELLSNPATAAGLRNSLTLALVAATLVVLVTCVLSLYVHRAGRLTGGVIDAGLKLPGALGAPVLVVGILLTFSGAPFWYAGTLTILFLGYVLLCVPNASIASDAAVAGVGEELMEASSIAGAGELRTFRRVVLPLLIPGMVGAWAIVFVRVMGDVTVSSLLAGAGNPVIGFQLVDAQQNGSPADVAALAAVLTLISAGTLFLAVLYGRRTSRWTAGVTRG
ncbi:ABC transporter permease [Actinomadura sp. LOL_016]|uniref:ABC transporter permease n=1 Tax=unclassified Actinomadura TaxID=2626254 RepID=UPI003A7F650D